MCRERTDLAIQLKDTKSVVGRLKFVISIILHILFAFFYLTIFNVRIFPEFPRYSPLRKDCTSHDS